MGCSFGIEADSADNPIILGKIADQEAGYFSYPTFADFLKKQQQKLAPPVKPSPPICFEDNPEKQKVFAMVGQRLKAQYQTDLRTYENLKAEQETIREYPPDFSGYAGYIQNHFPLVLPFRIRRHLIPVGENHRQKHTYITGGSGSGKSEVIKSFVWHYLTRNTHTGLVLIDPHGTLAEQVAKFKPNAENERLIYIDPAIDHRHFPCLNPFDIEGKESMGDIPAENYAEEFRIVFVELLKGDFTDQMNTILIYTLPVMMKYPNSSIYDLLLFLEVGGAKVAEYIEFAKKRFNNRSLLDFLTGQYENDKTYKTTRNSLQTRLRAIFSSTVLQAVSIEKYLLKKSFKKSFFLLWGIQ
jgi:Type IV secretion-system coupling protein DNA-binding domain